MRETLQGQGGTGWSGAMADAARRARCASVSPLNARIAMKSDSAQNGTQRRVAGHL
jgi:hypothetical protein